MGGQCCASRSNNLNPLSGPNGLEVSADGNFLYVGNGSSSTAIFDLSQTITSGGTTPPTVIATLVSGTSPDYDGPLGIGPCQASANGRAFSDPTCGDLRGDELATTGATPAMRPARKSSRPPDGNQRRPRPSFCHDLRHHSRHPCHRNGTTTTLPPVNPAAPYSPGGSAHHVPSKFCVMRPRPDLLRWFASEQYQHRDRRRRATPVFPVRIPPSNSPTSPLCRPAPRVMASVSAALMCLATVRRLLPRALRRLAWPD